MIITIYIYRDPNHQNDSDVRKSRKIVRVSGNEIKALKEILENFRTTKEPSSTFVSNAINENHSEPSISDFRASPKAPNVQDMVMKFQRGNTLSRLVSLMKCSSYESLLFDNFYLYFSD